MRIVLWGINYSPELIGIAPFNRELADALAAQGHEVEMVTTFAYYPQWKRAPEDQGRLARTDLVGAIRVHRCWCYVPQRVTTIKRFVHELSFGLATTLRLLTLRRADIYVVVSPPLILGFFATLLGSLQRSRYVFHVQDLQPDAAVGLGMVQRGWLVRSLYILEAFAYRHAAQVSGISHGMLAAFTRKQVPRPKQRLFPNWIRGQALQPASAAERTRAREKFGVPPGALLAVYAGNLGKKQGLEILGRVAALVAAAPAGRESLRLIIAGDGAMRPEIERLLAGVPAGGVQLLPLLSDPDYHALLHAADVALITQAAGTGEFFFPSKLLTVLAAGLPVVAVADETSELAVAVQAGAFGSVVRPGDAPALYEMLRRLAAEPGTLAAWRRATAWVQQFSPGYILPSYGQALADIGRAEAAPRIV